MTLADSPLPDALPDFAFEDRALRAGAALVGGIDEAGRGPLAGPVVVAAVVLDRAALPEGLNDSKKLLPARREALFAAILATSDVAVVSAPCAVIDRLNIRGATLWAMARAARALSCRPGHLLVDGRDVPDGLPCRGEAVIGGDGRCLSIAAASIVAKVMRDRMCAVMHLDCPDFGFIGHKGYGTAAHLDALGRLGPSVHHRLGFAPVAMAAAQRA